VEGAPASGGPEAALPGASAEVAAEPVVTPPASAHSAVARARAALGRAAEATPGLDPELSSALEALVTSAFEAALDPQADSSVVPDAVAELLFELVESVGTDGVPRESGRDGELPGHVVPEERGPSGAPALVDLVFAPDGRWTREAGSDARVMAPGNSASTSAVASAPAVAGAPAVASALAPAASAPDSAAVTPSAAAPTSAASTTSAPALAPVATGIVVPGSVWSASDTPGAAWSLDPALGPSDAAHLAPLVAPLVALLRRQYVPAPEAQWGTMETAARVLPGTLAAAGSRGAVGSRGAPASSSVPTAMGLQRLPTDPAALGDEQLAQVIMGLPPAMAAQVLAAGVMETLPGAMPGAIPSSVPGAMPGAVPGTVPAPPESAAGNAGNAAMGPGAEMIFAPLSWRSAADRGAPVAAGVSGAGLPGGSVPPPPLAAPFGDSSAAGFAEAFLFGGSGSGDGSYGGDGQMASFGTAAAPAMSAAASGSPGAAALARAPLDRPAVQRAVDDPAPAAAPEQPADGGANGAEDVDRLADEVYRILRWRLLAERERSLL
jgi:hypothetical protein